MFLRFLPSISESSGILDKFVMRGCLQILLYCSEVFGSCFPSVDYCILCKGKRARDNPTASNHVIKFYKRLDFTKFHLPNIMKKFSSPQGKIIHFQQDKWCVSVLEYIM